MKDILLDTAIGHFGRHGFEGAATRAIAKEADTAMSSITYHFGGKQGLYLACADHIAGCVCERFDPFITGIESNPPTSREDAVEALLDLLEIFAGVMLAPESENWSYFIVREQHAPTEAFERLWNGVMKRIIAVVLSLIHTARPDLSDAEARACAVALWGQALILRTGRASVCRVMQVDDLDEATARTLIAQFVANTRSILCAETESD